ncbi:MAG: M20/M25/M40 family metallo-hydrolase [Clostridia bacterium]|nr:M20/M25/M40 family metallo-hydrolase [Clostridia bacterium]
MTVWKPEREAAIDLLRDLSLSFGPTGCEGEVARKIMERIQPLCDSLCYDRMGNVLALCRFGEGENDRRKVMISAHMDEVGIMITEICDDGLCRFDTVGGIHRSVLEGRTVTVGDEIHRLQGVIASKAIHHKTKKERNQLTPWDQLYLDIGVSNREEAETLVSVGDLGTFDSDFYLFGKDDSMVKGKALDDRMGCAAMILVMAELRKHPLSKNLDLYFCFTVREELGLSGAKVAAAKIRPDLAIVLETTAVGDLAEVTPGKQVANVGQGGVLSVMDRSTVYDQAFLHFALQTAKEDGIPCQLKRYVSGGNDAGSIHKTGEGVRCLALSAPTRYLHSPSCVTSVEDYLSIAALVRAMLSRMSGDTP